jgi:hypothetical protein
MRTFLAAALLASTFSLPVASTAEAGFWTSAIKGAIKNNIRHAACKLKRTC